VVRAAFGSFVCEAGRFFLAGERPALLFALRGIKVIPTGWFVNAVIPNPMHFKAAADILLSTEPVTAIEIAERLGKDPHTIRRARMSGPNARSAPKGWEAVVADLAEKHADELEQRVLELRKLADELRKE
jgi:predicted transcriptional regulator